MTSPFAEALVDLNDELDAEFGELFEFRPMAKANVNMHPQADPERSSKDVYGRYLAKHLPMAALDENARRKGTYYEHAGGSMTAPAVSIDDAEFADGAPARQFDRLMRKDTGDVFEISDVQPEGQGRRRYVLKHLTAEIL